MSDFDPPILFFDHPSGGTPADADALNTIQAWAADGLNKLIRGQTFIAAKYGAVGDGVTDDTVALQACIDAALAAAGDVVVLLQSGATYLVNAAPRHDRGGNSILSYAHAGVGVLSDRNRSLSIVAGTGNPGTGNSPHAKLKTTRTTDSYSGTYGPPSVFGGKTDEGDHNDDNPSMGFMTTRNVRIEVPADPHIAGFDALDCWGVDSDMKVATVTLSARATQEHAFGIRMGGQGGSAHAVLRNAVATGMYAAFVIPVPDHIRLDTAYAYHCNIGLAFQEPQFTEHAIGAGGYLISEGCDVDIGGWDPTTGIQDLSAADATIAGLLVDLETHLAPFDKTVVVQDANNMLKGRITFHNRLAADPFGITGGNNLEIATTRHEDIQSISAASSFRVPPQYSVVNIAGTGTIDYIRASYVGRRITLIPLSTPTITNNGSSPPSGYAKVRLNRVGNWHGQADSSISLIYDGVRWVEIGRSNALPGMDSPTLGGSQELPLPGGQDAVFVTGLTAVKFLQQGYPGQRVTLVFTSSAGAQHNQASPPSGYAAMFLAASATFSGSGGANRTLTLVYDGTVWQETARKIP